MTFHLSTGIPTLAEGHPLDEGQLSMGKGRDSVTVSVSISISVPVRLGSVSGGGTLRQKAMAKAMAMAMAKAKAKHFIKNFQAIKQNFVQHLPNCVISI